MKWFFHKFLASRKFTMSVLVWKLSRQLDFVVNIFRSKILHFGHRNSNEFYTKKCLISLTIAVTSIWKLTYRKVESGTTIQEIKKRRNEFMKQTKVTPDNPWTGIGCVLGWVSPVPSCPYSLLPHAHSIPSSRRAKLWNAPTAISLTFSRPCTRTGVDICFLNKKTISCIRKT